MAAMQYDKWGLDNSILSRNGHPVFELKGLAGPETTSRERKELRRVICGLLNAGERQALPYICDWDHRAY